MTPAYRIFLAEDDDDDRNFFEVYLNDRTDVALTGVVANGIELLNALREKSDDELPELIILDQNMPRLNGLQTLSMLKTDLRFQHLPVMIYSTYANESLRQSSEEMGAAFVLSKPSDKAGYNKMIDDFLALVATRKISR